MPQQLFPETDHFKAFFKQDNLMTGDAKPLGGTDPTRAPRPNMPL